mmetsp:Transcript_19586/g.53621  ORF Transcript_19586/g.53621 Transcript_19586/m.53621 type:complete len:486 (-) Transcript_19586:1860-3317(-)
MRGCVEYVVVGPLERREHERRSPHPGNAVSVDAEDRTTVRHAIAEHLHVPSIHGDPVPAHRLVNFRHDCPPCRLDTQDLLHLNHVVRMSAPSLDAWDCHHVFETIALHQDVVSDLRPRIVFVDHRAVRRLEAMHHCTWQRSLQLLQREKHHRVGLRGRLHSEFVELHHLNVVRRQPQAAHVFVVQKVLPDSVDRDLQLQLPDRIHVQLDADEATFRRLVNLFEIQGDVAERRAFDAAFDDTRRHLVVLVHQRASDDWRGNRLRRVDDLLDPRNTQRDVHARHACEVESLECHLRRGFPDGLRRDRANCLPWHEHGLHVLVGASVHERLQVQLSRATPNVGEVQMFLRRRSLAGSVCGFGRKTGFVAELLPLRCHPGRKPLDVACDVRRHVRHVHVCATMSSFRPHAETIRVACSKLLEFFWQQRPHAVTQMPLLNGTAGHRHGGARARRRQGEVLSFDGLVGCNKGDGAAICKATPLRARRICFV